ncbi:MAG: UDP-N-acetylglucosamine 2-epimerase (hydrolyzing) [Verrucomicrobia bacterium]|nr:UDP-N-acetylglucosamine 2-epimerase (hydrolyzing) [Verrucomicrobiota bacterium]
MIKRKILVVLVDRANYGRMRLVMKAIQSHPLLELMSMCAGSMVLERFGTTVDEVVADGFEVHARVFMELEGSVPVSMAKSVGFGVIEFASEFNKLRPDIVLLIGDRYEALAAAIAAAYLNIPVAHIQGGEVSGSIDESARHAITKFAHWHFPATKRAADYIYRMGEKKECIFMVGCPVGDYVMSLDDSLPDDVFKPGSGAMIDSRKPFDLVIFHPITTEFGAERSQVRELLEALADLKRPTVFLWPNIDAGADHISKELRIFRDRYQPNWLRFITNLTPVNFQKVLKRCTVAIGNSSSFVRDSTFTGTPVVLVGERQHGREIGRNTTCVPAERASIREAILAQSAHGSYPPDLLYGDGQTSARIAEALANVRPFVQKHLDYIRRDDGE